MWCKEWSNLIFAINYYLIIIILTAQYCSIKGYIHGYVLDLQKAIDTCRRPWKIKPLNSDPVKRGKVQDLQIKEVTKCILCYKLLRTAQYILFYKNLPWPEFFWCYSGTFVYCISPFLQYPVLLYYELFGTVGRLIRDPLENT